MSDPVAIDDHLRQFLLERPDSPIETSSDLAAFLFDKITDFIYEDWTPSILCDVNPARPKAYYKSCLFWSTLLGRALVITEELCHHSTNAEERQTDGIIDNHWDFDIARRIKIPLREWNKTIKNLHNRLFPLVCQALDAGLFCEGDPEVGARHSVAILALTCLNTTTIMIGEGGRGKFLEEYWEIRAAKGYCEDTPWTGTELRTQLLDTQNIPREFTDAGALRDHYFRGKNYHGRTDMPTHISDLYVPQEVLEALDEAREHTMKDEPRDLTSHEIFSISTFKQLMDENNTVDGWNWEQLQLL